MNQMLAAAPLVEGRDHFLRCADEIGRRLCRDALRHGDNINWLRTEPEQRENLPQLLVRPVGADLYQGTAGIMLFLALLHQRTGDRLVARTLDQALAAATKSAGTGAGGFYTGDAGIGALFISLGLLQGREGLVEMGLARLGQAVRLHKPAALDLLGGAAGLIPLLLTLARHHDRPDFQDHALTLGATLLAAGQSGPDGLCWPSGTEGPAPSGFAHGGAGMVPALASLHLASGETHWAEALTEVLRYQRAQFNGPMGNWPDYRDAAGTPSPQPSFGASWCHGAAGIGRSRLWLLAAGAQDPVLGEELEAALRVVAMAISQPAASAPADFSYCHGLAGMADLLLDAGLWLGRPELTALAAAAGYRGIERHAVPRIPWPCGLHGVGELPGLMTGLAGIGHFYLRLHDPLTTGSLLLPDPYLGTRNNTSGMKS
ncbi:MULTISPECIES: lanthionine synthetase LanC family protein [unclassified Azospirillum]|uniref:lanthionine synthetase LanC family protein n=1 Tax=unclassified Azospirillum TaxID=2630922 RepID=UPI000B668BBD|nr:MULTISPECIES: lanthionine synthetase LanC family protein [unclassified Azospirillum]SNT12030.1 Lanthionine synthetase C-like protein [Azospirillum sp. RU38E]SNT26092.1 Lanthionine synthetase C-like protein [Azospirillum sp. RU37A]